VRVEREVEEVVDTDEGLETGVDPVRAGARFTDRHAFVVADP
jgi:hypothetical protein